MPWLIYIISGAMNNNIAGDIEGAYHGGGFMDNFKNWVGDKLGIGSQYRTMVAVLVVVIIVLLLYMWWSRKKEGLERGGAVALRMQKSDEVGREYLTDYAALNAYKSDPTGFCAGVKPTQGRAWDYLVAESAKESAQDNTTLLAHADDNLLSQAIQGH